MDTRVPLLISFSGGKTSAFMTRFLCEHFQGRKIAIVFANTGKEREETLVFVERCDKEWGLGVIWVEAVIDPAFGKGTRHKVVTFASASREGQPFEDMIRKYGIPNKSFPHCTRELKARTIASYAKNQLGWTVYETAIGIRSDEAHRINRAEAKRQRWVYPLTDLISANKNTINDWWAMQPFTLALQEHQGNCDLCWKKSDKKLVKLINEAPDALAWWETMEERYSADQAAHRQLKIEPSYFFRGNRSAGEIRELAQKVTAEPSLFGGVSDVGSECFCLST